MQYQVIDVFTDELFGGNSAGVCLLDSWLPEAAMQSIAAENRLSETAFLVKRDGYYDVRWFTPTIEVSLCGHATIASSFVLFEDYEKDADSLVFKSKSGTHPVSRESDLYYLDFPAMPATPWPIYPAIVKSFGFKPSAAFMAMDYMVLVDSEETLRNLRPDFAVLKQLADEAESGTGDFGVIVTSTCTGCDCDYVSRFFAPSAGIDEDPATGRAQCSLAPFWSKELGKAKLIAKQLSQRGGLLFCEDRGERVRIGGHAVRYMRGEIAYPSGLAT